MYYILQICWNVEKCFVYLVCIGSFGVQCVSPCPVGYYGMQCSEKCQCSDCDSITGECSTVLTGASTKTTGTGCCCSLIWNRIILISHIIKYFPKYSNTADVNL